MKNLVIAFLSSLILHAAAPAFSATETLAELYRSETEKVLNGLEALNLKKIYCAEYQRGCFSTDRMRKDLATKVRFIELERFHKDPEANRWGAFYDPKKRVIYLNRSVPHDPELIGFIGLHELMGALGRPEPDFQVSLSSYYLLDLVRRDAEAPRIVIQSLVDRIRNGPTEARAPKNADSRLLSGGEGGGVVVGNGGDTRTLRLRIAVYRDLQDKVVDTVLAAIRLSNVPIEITETGSEIRYIRSKADPYFMYLTKIEVPVSMMEGSLSPSSAAVKDISWYLRSTQPRASGYPVIEVGEWDFFPADFSVLHPAAVDGIWKPKESLLRGEGRLP